MGQNSKKEQSRRSESARGGHDTDDKASDFLRRAKLIDEDAVATHVGFTVLQKRMLLHQEKDNEKAYQESLDKDLVVDFGTLGSEPERYTAEGLDENKTLVRETVGPEVFGGCGARKRWCLFGCDSTRQLWGNDLAKSFFKDKEDGERMAQFMRNTRTYRGLFTEILFIYNMVYGGFSVYDRVFATAEPSPPAAPPPMAPPMFE